MGSFAARFMLYFLLSPIVTDSGFLSSVKSVFGLDENQLEPYYAPFESGESANYERPMVRGIDLKMDQAYLNVTSVDNSIHEFLYIYGVSRNCYKCHLQKLTPVIRSTYGDSRGFIVDTRWPFTLHVNTSSNKSCSKVFHFGEGGHYCFEVKSVPKTLRCAMVVDVKPSNSFIPILVAAAILLGLALFVIFIKWLRRFTSSLSKCAAVTVTDFFVNHYYQCRRWTYDSKDGCMIRKYAAMFCHQKDLGTSSQTGGGSTPNHPVTKRLLSLDAFRGLSLVIMVFVNFGGGGYWFFQHSKWNGLTVADLVFPWFIFIMGVSLALSFRSLMQKRVGKMSIFVKIVRRTLILFALGLLINKGVNLNDYRIPGVLQRFAFSYFVVASLELFLTCSTENAAQTVWWFTIREVIQLWKQWIVMLLLLTIYLILTYVVDVPGCPRGYVGPGGIGEGFPESENCTGGMAGYIDRKFFGENHIYSNPTCKKLYRTNVPYDPEGALGSITSAFLTFLGLQAGKILVTHNDHIKRLRRLIMWSLILGFIAIALCGGSKNAGLIPINKNLWSLSFVLANGAMAYALLAFCYLTIDDKHWWDGTPFIFPGMNSILVYCGHEVLSSFFPFNWELHPVNHAKKLAMNIWGASAWVIIAYYCYKIDFFVKI